MIVLRDSSKSRQITNTTSSSRKEKKQQQKQQSDNEENDKSNKNASEVSECVINPSSKKDESASNAVGPMEASSTSAQFAQDEKGHICCMARC